MNRLRWWVGRAWHALGLPGVAGLALLVLGAAGWLLELRPLMQQTERTRADLHALAASTPRHSSPAAARPSVLRQLEDFEGSLAPMRSTTGTLVRMGAVAQRHGVRLSAGDFRLETSSEGALARYVMELPVTADYRGLRRFVSDLLHEQPALALETMQMQRGTSAPAAVEARLRFVLHLRTLD